MKSCSVVYFPSKGFKPFEGYATNSGGLYAVVEQYRLDRNVSQNEIHLEQDIKSSSVGYFFLTGIKPVKKQRLKAAGFTSFVKSNTKHVRLPVLI